MRGVEEETGGCGSEGAVARGRNGKTAARGGAVTPILKAGSAFVRNEFGTERGPEKRRRLRYSGQL